jgi:hypothetical protein
MAVLMTGGFIALSMGDRRPVFTRAAWAALIAICGVALWCRVWGISWVDVELALTRQWWAIWRDLSERLGGPAATPERIAFFERLSDAGRPMAQLFPARLVVSGILGLVLAAYWNQRVTGRPWGRAVDRLGDFRFTDHLIWVVILAVAILLLPGLPPVESLADESPLAAVLLSVVVYWQPTALNLLVICAALYVARGAAVLRRLLRAGPAMAFAVVATIFLLPFALVGLAALGLTDTWVDFRRYMRAPAAR